MMAKARKNKRNKGSKKTVRVGVFRPKILLAVLTATAISFGIFVSIRYFLLNAPMFTIEKVVMSRMKGYSLQNAKEELLKRYKGRNIFTIDLKQAETLLKNDFPNFKGAEVRRILPNALEINIVSREPAAVIDSSKSLVVDAEGVVLAVNEKPKGLPVIKGFSLFMETPSPGEQILNRTVRTALDLIEAFHGKITAPGYDIEYVDISDRKNTEIIIRSVAIKMGTDAFLKKLDKLEEILNDPGISLKDLRYIDLRFEDAVISPK